MALFGKALALSSVGLLLVAYFIHSSIDVPPGIEQRGDAYWAFAEMKAARGLAVVGEYLGIGHRTKLIRDNLHLAPIGFSGPINSTGVKVGEASFDGIRVLVYQPEKKVKNSPALIWIHGGGWTLSSADDDKAYNMELVRRLQIVVVSIDYRLAPEFLFPTSIDDCFTASKYFLDHASEYDVDQKRVAIAGLSAGGNLAAAVSIKFRNLKLPVRPKVQALLAPCLQAFDFNTPSYQSNVDNSFLPTSFMVDFWLWYAFGPDGHLRRNDYMENMHTSPDAKKSNLAKYVSSDLLDPKYVNPSYKPTNVNFGSDKTWKEIKDVFLNPYFAPLMSQDLSELPEAYIATAEWDVLRDDGLMYGKRLSDGGVKVEMKHYEKGFHHLLIWINQFNISDLALIDLVDYLSRKL